MNNINDDMNNDIVIDNNKEICICSNKDSEYMTCNEKLYKQFKPIKLETISNTNNNNIKNNIDTELNIIYTSKLIKDLNKQILNDRILQNPLFQSNKYKINQKNIKNPPILILDIISATNIINKHIEEEKIHSIMSLFNIKQSDIDRIKTLDNILFMNTDDNLYYLHINLINIKNCNILMINNIKIGIIYIDVEAFMKIAFDLREVVRWTIGTLNQRQSL